MAHPARQRRPDAVDVRGRDVDEGRRPGSAVEVLVGAADREVGAGGAQVDRQRARRMGQIPYRQCAGGVGGLGQPRHVVLSAGPVVDLGQHQGRDALVQRPGDFFRGHQPDLVALAEGSDQPLRDVEVRRKVAVVREDDAPLRPHLQGRRHRLVDLDGQRVAHRHGAGRGADQTADALAEPARLVHPARVVPAAESASRPIPRTAGGPRARAPRAEGVPASCRPGRSPRREAGTASWSW